MYIYIYRESLFSGVVVFHRHRHDYCIVYMDL